MTLPESSEPIVSSPSKAEPWYMIIRDERLYKGSISGHWKSVYTFTIAKRELHPNRWVAYEEPMPIYHPFTWDKPVPPDAMVEYVDDLNRGFADKPPLRHDRPSVSVGDLPIGSLCILHHGAETDGSGLTFAHYPVLLWKIRTEERHSATKLCDFAANRQIWLPPYVQVEPVEGKCVWWRKERE
jgi:hypothetical protein